MLKPILSLHCTSRRAAITSFRKPGRTAAAMTTGGPDATGRTGIPGLL